MVKHWYQITLEPLSPFHIGYFKYGVIAETRLFIPGWTIWGALVNAMAKEENEYEMYQEMFRSISCFYPVLVEEGRNLPTERNALLFPSLNDGQFFFKNCNKQQDERKDSSTQTDKTVLELRSPISEEKFRVHFTDTYLSTSIIPDSRTAKEHSLHEIEVILPKSKINPKYRLYWQGVLGLKEKGIPLQEGQTLRVGGEARYGFGDMKIFNIKEIGKLEKDSHFCGYKTDYFKTLKHYLSLNENLILKSSDIQQHRTERVILEFDFAKNKPEIKEEHLCLVPGSQVCLNETETFELDRGMLKLKVKDK